MCTVYERWKTRRISIRVLNILLTVGNGFERNEKLLNKQKIFDLLFNYEIIKIVKQNFLSVIIGFFIVRQMFLTFQSDVVKLHEEAQKIIKN